jgi:hypothetical protein
MGLSNCQCLIVASRNHRNNVEFIQVVLSGVSEDVCAGFILDDHQLDRLPRAVAEDQARRKHLLFPDKPRQRAESAYAHPPVIDRILARSSATPISPLGCLLDWTKFVDENHSQKSSGSIVSRSFFTASALS